MNAVGSKDKINNLAEGTHGSKVELIIDYLDSCPVSGQYFDAFVCLEWESTASICSAVENLFTIHEHS